MPESVEFMPKASLLSFEESNGWSVASGLGIDKIRFTGRAAIRVRRSGEKIVAIQE